MHPSIKMRGYRPAMFLLAGLLLASFARPAAAELLVGTATTSITPERPVALAGQFNLRIARHVDNPCTANVLVLQTRQPTDSDQAILVSCDVVGVPGDVAERVRKRVADLVPGLATEKIFLSATHTHSAPAMLVDQYFIPDSQPDVMRPAEYNQFFVEQVSDAIARAWNSRQAGAAGWGLGHAVVADNRRVSFADGRTVMYGDARQPGFRQLENGEDHGIEVLCFWDGEQRLVGTAINVACPSQEVESISNVNADFWHPVREALQKKYGAQLVVLGWTGAAGDQSPHSIYRKAAEERMRRLTGKSRMDILAGRIVQAFDEAYAGAVQEMHAELPLVHNVQTIELAGRAVTPEEYLACKATVERLAGDERQHMEMHWNRGVVERYERQQGSQAAPHAMELHVIRLGDIAIATNEFELFTQYGIQMKARSPALQTFVIQLGSGTSSYLPTPIAVQGGGYSAVVQSSLVSPEGGQQLVDRTVDVLRSLWPEAK